MGIKNLLKFLSQFDGVVNKNNCQDYKYEKVAIDISIILYKVIIAIRNSGADLMNKKGEIVSHILGLFNKTIYLLKLNIIPIYVFDGKSPELKSKVIEERKEIKKKAWEKLESNIPEIDRIKYFKRTVSISKKQLDECKLLLKIMGIPYIEAPEEADAQCAWLVKNNFADGVLTEDMDILTFGADKIYRNLGSFKKETLEIKLENILEKIDLNYDQFIDLCILFGCDYCDRIKDIQPMKVYNIYKQTKDLNTTFEILKKDYCVPKIDNIKEIRSYFKDPPVVNINDNINLNKPDIKLIEDTLVNEYGLIKSKIINKIKYLDVFYNKVKNI